MATCTPLERCDPGPNPGSPITERLLRCIFPSGTRTSVRVMGSRNPTYSEEEVRDAVANSQSLADALRRLGLRPVGGNYKTLHRYIELFGVSTDHLDPNWTKRSRFSHTPIPLEDVLVENSTYSRTKLKRRLYEAGLKQRRCELCDQGEIWQGEPMALIIDHINGVGDDNRLENLRIVCPNCAATLDTHCGRKNRILTEPRSCLHCGMAFSPRYPTHRYCSHACGVYSSSGHTPRPETRKAERPPYEQLMAELAESNWSAVARRYGVSDNAVRKWVRWYEADAKRRDEEG